MSEKLNIRILWMQYIQGISQLQIYSLEDKINADNPVRFIDAFVSLIDLKKVGFVRRIVKPKADQNPRKTTTKKKRILNPLKFSIKTLR